MRYPPSSTAARGLRWPRLRELAQRPPNLVGLRRCCKAVLSHGTFPPVHETGPARAGCGERRDRTLQRVAIAFSLPRRGYAGIEAGKKIGSKTGSDYLAPSLTTRRFGGPKTKLRTSVFRRDKWALRLITNACNCRKRYRMKKHWRVASAVHAAALVRRPHEIPTWTKLFTRQTLIIHHFSQFFSSLKERHSLRRNMHALTCLGVPAIP
jgi:hypothetical protein